MVKPEIRWLAFRRSLPCLEMKKQVNQLVVVGTEFGISQLQSCLCWVLIASSPSALARKFHVPIDMVVQGKALKYRLKHTVVPK